MSGICGWLAGAPREDSRALLDRMTRRIGRFDRCEALSLIGRCAVLGASGPGSGTSLHASAAVRVAISGTPRFADDELEAERAERGAAATFARHFPRDPAAGVRALRGGFVLAIVDEDSAEAVLAVDRVGAQGLAWSLGESALVFATSADAVTAFPGASAGEDPQAIYDYVHFHAVPGPSTAYRGVRRLAPGSLLRYRSGRADIETYWRVRYEEHHRTGFETLKAEFREKLRDAVRGALGARTGAFLSGGTDSSTIAGILGEVSGSPARTYSIGFDAKGYDEMEYARIAARHFGTEHHEYYVTPEDVVAAVPLIAAVHDQPFGNASAVPTYYCAKLARDDGVDILLGGDGGDELFGGNDRYAKQHLYSLYSDLPAFLRKGLVEPLAFFGPERGILGKAQRYFRNASQPMPARYDNYNLLERLGATTVFTPEFLEIVDPGRPAADMKRVYDSAEAETLINRMLALDLKYTLADNDLPKVSRSCELAGVPVAYPMLDPGLLEFASRLAPRQKLRGTQLRYFFKEALRGFLPEAILAKTKHGFGLPVGTWLQTYPRLRELALDSLRSLRSRGQVRGEFLDELTGLRVNEHASYYGTMVWILMMLEQWYRSRDAHR